IRPGATGAVMIRALGLFSLMILAACVSSRHAARSSPQVACAIQPGEPSPADPYAEGPVGAGENRSCAPGQTCSFECPGGGCSFLCNEASTCNVECDGGGCRLGCGYNATCNLQCDGGRCGTGCAAGATCNVECDGGSCAHACAPEASCHTDC